MVDETKSRLLSGSLFGFFQTMLMAFAMLIPTWYFSSLSLGITVFAFLLLIGDVFSFLMKPVIGFLTDRHGERYYLMIGGLLFFLPLFLIGQTTSIVLIVFLKIVSGIASALVFVLILIYSLRLVREKPDRKVGLFGGLYNLGWIVGLLIPGLLLDRMHPQPGFYLILCAGVIWLLFMFRFAKKYESKVSVKASFSFVKKIPVFIVLKAMDLAMFSAFLFYFSNYALTVLQLPRSQVSFIVVTEVCFFALSMFFVGRISNKSSRRFWVPLCILFHVLGAGTLVFAAYQNILVLYYLVGIFIGIAGGFIDIWIYSQISERFASEEKGKVIGTLGWSYDLATICGAGVPSLFLIITTGMLNPPSIGPAAFTSLFVFPVVILIAFLVGRKYAMI
ncbi:MAG: MFS transporter [Methanobacteriota archaeon]